ncbi:hypothetical protein M409DRAFT_30004 [Zasmidium cellare ATCC 36951]|uniref:Fungal N-terminal domain-containing protein n=1 Tax=Zasmidium cellare ATCC 36951 TaxID=1080233 RepID=A0A6A6C135_ZASCE|nr:uncharacterized protein M409DRAFT_30004 [Zasmidium cellare ATCC 36951]KAF2159529.1 hypothetical protein M409DRAFT_30004 [Zasmidium cellare ATCC 36951]
MPDPLSIVTGVAALLQSTWTVSVELKKFYDGVTVVKQSIQDLQQDVDGLSDVLGSMRTTFAVITAEQQTGTGHVASHWGNVSKAIVKGKDMLDQMVELVLDIGQTKKFLDGPRKQLRLNMAEERLTAFRGHIRSFQDTLQLSLATIILSNQEAYQKTNAQLLPNLGQLSRDVRKIAHDLDAIKASQNSTPSPQERIRAELLSSTRDCVQSAASIISSSTITGQQDDDARSVVADSNYGDCFPAEQIPAIDRYMRSDTVHGFEEMTPRAAPQSVIDVPTWSDESEGSSESESDVEIDLVDSLLEEGKQEAAVGDFKAAKESFSNCLKRLPAVDSTRKHDVAKRLDVLSCLLDAYKTEQNWLEAQKVLTQRIELRKHLLRTDDADYAHDVYLLACVMHESHDRVEAQLHARRAWARFKRLKQENGVRRCLLLLIAISTADNNVGDVKAYTVTLKRMGGNALDAPETPNAGVESSLDMSMKKLASPQPDVTKIPEPQHEEAVSLGLPVEDTTVIAIHPDEADTACFASEEGGSDNIQGCNVEDLPEIEQVAPLLDSKPTNASQESVSETKDDESGSEALQGDQLSDHDSISASSSSDADSNRELIPVNNNEIRPSTPTTRMSCDDENLAGLEELTLYTVEEETYPEPEQATTIKSSTTSRASLESGLDNVSQTSTVRSAPISPTGSSTGHRWPPRIVTVEYVISSGDEPQIFLGCNAENDWRLYLSRTYEDFESLQTDLWCDCPNEAAGLSHRVLPLKFGQLNYTREQQIEQLNDYLQDVLALPDHILDLPLIQNFFKLRPGDGEDAQPKVVVTTPGSDTIREAKVDDSPRPELNAASLAKASGEPSRELQRTSGLANASNVSVASTENETVTSSRSLKTTSTKDKRSSWRRLFSANGSKEEEPVVEPTGEIRRKVVIVGDGASGKSCLLHVFVTGSYPPCYVPTVFENYVADIELDGKMVQLALWDTCGLEDFDRLRPLSYPDAHAIIILFGIDSPDSLDNVQEKWISEVLHFNPGVPYFLVGNKKDLRHDQKTIEWLKKTYQSPVTHEQGEDVRKKIGANKYLECSAVTTEGIQELFVCVTRAALKMKKPKKKR